jgi:hypothetical protein
MATNTTTPTCDDRRRRLLVLEKSMVEAGECVEWRSFTVDSIFFVGASVPPSSRSSPCSRM